MNRIQTTLDALSASSRKVLVSYIVAGDPDIESTVPLMHELVKAGTDIIELGVPFSDPSAEGPTIQRAHERALANNIGMADVFAIVEDFRKNDQQTPVVLMGYANPIEWMGYEVFSKRAKDAGADAALTVDLPPEEATALNECLKEQGLYNVFLIAPTTTEERIDEIVGMASGFIYSIALKGVTGSGALDVDLVAEKLSQIRNKTTLPLCVGFGIKNAESAQAVAQVADGVVIGSAIVDVVAQADSQQAGLQAANRLIADIRQAID